MSLHSRLLETRGREAEGRERAGLRGDATSWVIDTYIFRRRRPSCSGTACIYERGIGQSREPVYNEYKTSGTPPQHPASPVLDALLLFLLITFRATCALLPYYIPLGSCCCSQEGKVSLAQLASVFAGPSGSCCYLHVLAIHIYI